MARPNFKNLEVFTPQDFKVCKNLEVFTPQDFKVCFDHFSTLSMKDLRLHKDV